METRNFLLAHFLGAGGSLSHTSTEKTGGRQPHRAFYSWVRIPRPQEETVLPKVYSLSSKPGTRGQAPISQPKSGGYRLQAPSALDSKSLMSRLTVEGVVLYAKRVLRLRTGRLKGEGQT